MQVESKNENMRCNILLGNISKNERHEENFQNC